MTAAPDDRAPYARLTPHQMLDALAATGFPVTGGLLQLNSYENRVVQAALEGGGAVVAKFYRPRRWNDAQILEEHAFACELAADDLPIAAPLVLAAAPHVAPGARLALSGDPATLGHWTPAPDADDTPGATPPTYRFAVAPRRAGRAPELESPHTLAWLGRLLGRLHRVGAQRPFVHRRTLDCETYGAQARERVARSGLLTPAQSANWLTAADRAIDAARAAFAAAGPTRRLRLHGDCHPGNILWREEGKDAGPLFVDLDDACMGPAVQDLWMLLSGDRDAMQAQLGHVLGGYRAFMDFDVAELGLIEPLRALRMIHHSAWLAERWDDPAFPVAFPWFGTPAYWDQQTTQLREQLEQMALPPLQCW
ncbi:MAG: serine/threonine protein kinase [Burkholderiaceae bacterium]